MKLLFFFILTLMRKDLQQTLQNRIYFSSFLPGTENTLGHFYLFLFKQLAQMQPLLRKTNLMHSSELMLIPKSL